MKTSKPSSTVHHLAAGRRSSLVWLDPDDREKIAAAAKLSGMPVTQFLAFHGLTAAKKILAKKPDSPLTPL